MIFYTVNGRKSDHTSCYGNLYSDLRDIQEGGGQLKEFTLYLSNSVVRDRQLSNSGCNLVFQACDKTQIRQALRIARAVGFREWLPTNRQLFKDGFIKFNVNKIPFHVLVALTGFFRAWDNHTEQFNIYDKLTKEYNVEPYAAFAMAQSLDYYGGRWELNFNGEHSVVPFTICNKKGIKKFRTWTKRLSNLEPMAEEFKRTGKLNYNGRDDFFGAYCSGTSSLSDPEEVDGGMCGAMNHLVNGYNMYETSYVDLESYVEEVRKW